MAESEVQQVRRLSADNQTISKSDIPLKERFFRYFQHEITCMSPPQARVTPHLNKNLNQPPALQNSMDRLIDTSLVGGERADATDHCLAGIVRLSNEVKDAASYIPTYDQRVYAEVQRQNVMQDSRS